MSYEGKRLIALVRSSPPSSLPASFPGNVTRPGQRPTAPRLSSVPPQPNYAARAPLVDQPATHFKRTWARRHAAALVLTLARTRPNVQVDGGPKSWIRLSLLDNAVANRYNAFSCHCDKCSKRESHHFAKPRFRLVVRGSAGSTFYLVYLSNRVTASP